MTDLTLLEKRLKALFSRVQKDLNKLSHYIGEIKAQNKI